MLSPVLLALALATPPAPTPQAAPAERPATAPTQAVKPPAAPKAPRPPAAPRAAPAGEGELPVLQGFDKPSGKRFTGTFDDDDVDALQKIAEVADWSIVLPAGHHGTISARFKNVPVEDALRAVLAQGDLVARLDGGIVTVRPRPSAGFGIKLPALPPGASPEVQRRTEEAMRRAQREMERAEREMARAEENATGRRVGDKVVHGDVVVHAGETVRDVVALRGSIRVESGAQIRDAVAVLGGVTLESGAQAREAVAVGAT